jgi:histone acetyltransferase 1
MCITDYDRNEASFLQRVEQDAISFKPLGDKIHSYKRTSPSARGKGKKVILPENLDPDSEDTVEYEVYRVSGSGL